MSRRFASLAMSAALAASLQARQPGLPTLAAETPADQSVYALPTPATEDQGFNAGALSIDLKLIYLTDYIYRGFNKGKALNPGEDVGQANFQFDGKLAWDLGKLPHPFVGVFANVLESDPVSNFQEFRPCLGIDWTIRPLTLTVGNSLYTYPDRDDPRTGADLDTSEAFLRLTLDDSVLLRSQEPFLSPYVYAAYDYDRYDAWYLEAGIKHDFPIEKTGLLLTLLADVGYVINHEEFAISGADEDTGFQHYQIGLIARYSLNELLNIPLRYGRWSINGYIYYTDGIDDDLLSETGFWGGGGIQFSY